MENRDYKGQFIKGHLPWSKGLKGKHFSPKTEFKKKHKGYKAWLGKKLPLEMKNNISNHCKGKHSGGKSPMWKGDKVGYRALHYWVWAKLGKPKKCLFCNKKYTIPKSIHWANKSGKYLRDLTDWVNLCIKCHRKYDKI